MVCGYSLAKNCLREQYPIDLCIKQHKDLFDTHYFGVPFEHQDTDGTVDAIRKAARECGQNVQILRYDWGGDGAWTKESLDKIIQREMLQTITNRHGTNVDWIIKCDVDEMYHEKDFPKLKEFFEVFSEDDSITSIQTNYLQFCGSLAHTIKDPTDRVWHVFRGDSAPYYWGNDAMIIRTSKGQGMYLEDVFLHHVGYCKPTSLLTTKIREHIILNSSVYGSSIDSYQILKYNFEFPKHVPGKYLWPLGIAPLRGAPNECEYFPFNADDLPQELKKNLERFNHR